MYLVPWLFIPVFVVEPTTTRLAPTGKLRCQSTLTMGLQVEDQCLFRKDILRNEILNIEQFKVDKPKGCGPVMNDFLNT